PAPEPHPEARPDDPDAAPYQSLSGRHASGRCARPRNRGWRVLWSAGAQWRGKDDYDRHADDPSRTPSSRGTGTAAVFAISRSQFLWDSRSGASVQMTPPDSVVSRTPWSITSRRSKSLQ